MSYKLRYTRLAKQDLNEIYLYIAQDNPIRAIEFVERFRQHCGLLNMMPYRGASRDDLQHGIRTLMFERRATIAYRVREDNVQIVRVFYAGRDLRLREPEAD